MLCAKPISPRCTEIKKGAEAPLNLFQFVHHFGKSLWVVHGQVGKDFPVKVDAGCLQLAHQLRVGHAVESCASIDALNPQAAEVALLGFPVAVSITQAFFDRVLGDGPNIFLSPKKSFGKFEHPLALGAGCYMIH